MSPTKPIPTKFVWPMYPDHIVVCSFPLKQIMSEGYQPKDVDLILCPLQLNDKSSRHFTGWPHNDCTLLFDPILTPSSLFVGHCGLVGG
jgi:hypothetical protein